MNKGGGFVLIIVLLLLIVMPSEVVSAQDIYSPRPETLAAPKKKKTTADTLSQLKLHSPHRATIYSMMLPGLGQAYNKKYWKIPIIYVGGGVLGYLIVFNNGYYKDFKDAYLWVQTEGEKGADNNYAEEYNSEQLYSSMNYYRSNRDLCVVLTVVLYVLNIVDAAVDAHLYYFDVSEDLSIKLAPSEIQAPLTMPKQHPVVASMTLNLKL